MKHTFKVGDKLVHKFLGVVEYDDCCKALDELVGYNDSIHVLHDGDVLEVTLSLVSLYGTHKGAAE